jgi:ribonuclease P/MRP protein subunit RPP40
MDKWMAFLDSMHRQQAVAVEGGISELSPVISGVPQRTLLGPVLFLLHIADIASNVSAGTTTSSYVDDTMVQRSITDIDQDCRAQQQDLATIYSWEERVNMTFNSDKFECVRYWPGNSSVTDYQYLSPDLTPIEQNNHLRDLGVEISIDLKFNVHIGNVVTSASRMVGKA